jgi:hypothetical protein
MAKNALEMFVEGVQAAVINSRDALRAVSNSPGAAPVHAAIRQGTDEIAQVLPAFPDSMRTVAESGQLFEPTQAIVTGEITGRQMNWSMDR